MNDTEAVDAIKEVINIGIGEAANSLSELVRDRVQIRVPDIRILDLADVPAYMHSEMEHLGLCISQDFHGLISGKMVLAYSRKCSVSLLNRLYGRTRDMSSLTNTDIATLQEVGNIIMVSCISAIGNIIEGRLIFNMPQVTAKISNGYFEKIARDLEGFEKCIIIKNDMTIKKDDISGYTFIILTFQALQLVTQKLSKAIT